MASEYQAVQLQEEAAGKIVRIVINGKLTKEDYDLFVPEIERLIKMHGKVRMLVELVDFRGWSAAAAWEDAKWGLKHLNNIDRLAIVGERKWEKGMMAFCIPFTRAAIRYFDVTARDEAMCWIREGIQDR